MGGIFGGGAPKEQITTTKLDPEAERFRNEAYGRARNVANEGYTSYGGNQVAGATPESRQASAGMGAMPSSFMNLGQRAQGMQFGGGVDPNMHFGSGVDSSKHFGQDLSPYDQAGATGARAMGGDQGAIDRLMNPYQRNVIDAMGSEYDRIRGKTTMGANNDATAGGAFGGSRHALMQGERLGAVDRAEASDISSLLHSGFNETMDRAGSAAGMGLNAGDQRLRGQGMGADYELGAGAQRLQGQGMASQHQLGVGQQRLAGQGLQLDANGQAIQAGQAGMDALGQQFGMGDYYRNINQAGIDNQVDRFNEQRDWGMRGLNIMNGTMNGMPTGQSTSQPLYNGGRGKAAVGGALAGAPFGPAGIVAGGLGGLLFG